MSFRDDKRGQAIQVGAVLLFATLIIAFSTYQAFVVPSQNKAVEFDHNQRVQGDLQELRSAIAAMSSTDSRRSTAVQFGTQFPNRALFLNPPDPSGELSVTPYENGVEIGNLTAEDSNGYWNDESQSYTTSILGYAPRYSGTSGRRIRCTSTRCCTTASQIGEPT